MEFHHLNYIVISQKTDMSGTVTSREIISLIFLKIKLKSAGIRVVYKLIKTETEMLVVVIGARADDEVYDTAQHRAEKHNL